jgi:hygromycin-B 7''-O-kinase
MAVSLPEPGSFEQFEAFRTNPPLWLPAALDIARGHSLDCSDIHVFPNGSNLVVALGRKLILKIYPPLLRHQFVAELATLPLLEGRLSVPTPKVVVEGERDGWPYLVMTRMQGVTGEDAWPALPEDQKERVLRQIGGLIAEAQRAPAGELIELEPRWDRFWPKQIQGCRARHERLGLPQRYLDGLDEYIRDAESLIPSEVSPVLLTGEYIPENFLLRESSEGWELSALIDFGDVMTGWGEYDLVGPSTFMAGGEPGRIKNLLRGYGYADAQIDGDLRRRLMTLLLLHRFSHPAGQVRIDDWQKKARTLQELERLIWPIEGHTRG